MAKKNYSTEDIRRMYDFGRQYDVFGKWLKDCGFTMDNLPLLAKSEDGEDVIVDAHKDEYGALVWKITTFQDNGWTREDHYHEDGIVEELYTGRWRSPTK